MNIPRSWFVEVVTVEPYEGSGAYGERYGTPVTVLGHVSGGRRVARNTQGNELTTEQQVIFPNPALLADGTGSVDPSAVLTPETRVTSGELSATVVQVAEHRQPGTGALVYVSGLLG